LSDAVGTAEPVIGSARIGVRIIAGRIAAGEGHDAWQRRHEEGGESKQFHGIDS
jgi:hypothetical protein